MGLRQEYEKRVEKKLKEIADLEGELREAKAVLQAYNEFLRHLPHDSGPGKTPALRPGTDLHKAWHFLNQRGKPAHITDLLKGIGKEVTKENRVSLGGNLSWHVRKGGTFTRTAPNTFGLVGMAAETESEGEPSEDSLPDSE